MVWFVCTCHVELVGQQMCVGIVAWGWHGRKKCPHVLSKVILLQDATREQVSTHSPDSQSPAIYTHAEPEFPSECFCVFIMYWLGKVRAQLHEYMDFMHFSSACEISVHHNLAKMLQKLV